MPKAAPVLRLARVKGLLFAVLGGLCLHANRLLIKVAVDLSGLSPLESTFWRSLFFFIVTLIFALIARVDILAVPPAQRTWLGVRCFLGFLSTVTHFGALAQLPYATAIVLLFLYPVLTVFLAWIFLRERISFIDFVALLLAFIGVIIFANPQWIDYDDSFSSHP